MIPRQHAETTNIKITCKHSARKQYAYTNSQSLLNCMIVNKNKKYAKLCARKLNMHTNLQSLLNFILVNEELKMIRKKFCAQTIHEFAEFAVLYTGERKGAGLGRINADLDNFFF